MLAPELGGPGLRALAGERVRAVGGAVDAGASSVRCFAAAPAISGSAFFLLGDAPRGALDPKVR
ncbi:hypothetical protein OG223_34080 [Streptomyces sp. NBC_01478]|uniref:hypothetical protein n=1 Tax=Streptomyces sp. NBC_01478 TaxID=2903882 RepID=UPI002E364F53|nr:hypothetical protein [Streptomyces sp. NBC_01478]